MMAGPRPGQIDLWWTSLDDFSASERDACLELLSESELARWKAFKVETARTQYLAARGLVRSTLSRYRNIAPMQWRFEDNSYGRPFIDKSLDTGNLFFSLTHTDGLVACAVSAGAEIGIDVERHDRDIDPGELAPNVLTQQELSLLSTKLDSARKDFFFTLWTLKEAYVKAMGMGLSLPMNGVGFDLDSEFPTPEFSNGIVDEPSRWMFQTLRPTGVHIVSLAAASAQKDQLTVICRQTRAIHLG